MKIKQFMLVLSGLFLLEGCATIVEGNDQSILVNTMRCEQHGNPRCIVKNRDNAVVVTAPGSALIEKGASALVVTCVSDNKLAKGSTTVKSRYEAMNLGNILIGGIIGLGVDALSGAMWTYPNEVAVNMECASD